MMVLWPFSAETRYRDIVSDGAPADQAGWDGERYDRIADPQHRWGKAILPALTYRVRRSFWMQAAVQGESQRSCWAGYRTGGS